MARTARGYSAVSCECFEDTQRNHACFTWRVLAKLTLYGFYVERPSGAGREMTIGIYYLQSLVKERRRRGDWTHLRGGGSGQGCSAGGDGHARARNT
eukprot:2617383-Pleurochrysis_carterae.AAC.2